MHSKNTRWHLLLNIWVYWSSPGVWHAVLKTPDGTLSYCGAWLWIPLTGVRFQCKNRLYATSIVCLCYVDTFQHSISRVMIQQFVSDTFSEVIHRWEQPAAIFLVSGVINGQACKYCYCSPNTNNKDQLTTDCITSPHCHKMSFCILHKTATRDPSWELENYTMKSLDVCKRSCGVLPHTP